MAQDPCEYYKDLAKFKAENPHFEREKAFQDITHLLFDVYQKKNHDYGNSFSILRNEFPESILIRIFDKYNRLKTLMKDGELRYVDDETEEDTLLDLANYCIMEVVERRIARGLYES